MVPTRATRGASGVSTSATTMPNMTCEYSIAATLAWISSGDPTVRPGQDKAAGGR